MEAEKRGQVNAIVWAILRYTPKAKNKVGMTNKIARKPRIEIAAFYHVRSYQNLFELFCRYRITKRTQESIITARSSE